MSEGIPYADIAIIALIAIFILLRLRAVLGQKTGLDPQDFFKPRQPPSNPLKREDSPEEPAREPIVQIASALKTRQAPKEMPDPYAQSLPSGPVADGIADIKSKDPQFTATTFMEGAKMAYEMVFDAFAKGEKKTLEMLLSAEIFKEFVANIDARTSGETRTENTLVSVRAKAMNEARLVGNFARIEVRFESEQVMVERNAKGEIVGGDPNALHSSEDDWTFERDVTSKNPNWKIIET
jgi:predicted lipid-binding transport protein (Tim44 family)